MLRVVAGKYKGRKLNAPEGEHTKPTKDMVKEALFSSLGSLYGKSFLDLFSGSGSIGIEALSRGAESATFVDNSSEAYQVIKNNLQALGEEQNVQNSDVISFLSQAKESYDIVFLDPPYHFENIAKLFELLHSGILKTNSVVVYESAADEKIEEFAAGFELIKEKKYGITKLFYFKEEEN